MNCALLKEAVMDYIVAEKKSIMGKISFDNVPGSTVTDILALWLEGKIVMMTVMPKMARVKVSITIK